MTMHVEVVSAEERLYAGLAEFIVVPGEAGELGILPRHAPLLTRIRPGVVQIRRPSDTLAAGEDREMVLYVSGGLLEILPGMVNILADTAVRSEALDEARAEAAHREAEAALAHHEAGSVGYAHAQAELLQTLAQLRTLQRARKKH